jgi:hypothetical protein
MIAMTVTSTGAPHHGPAHPGTSEARNTVAIVDTKQNAKDRHPPDG